METLNETGEVVLISGSYELGGRGAGGQDALGQTHCVMPVPVYRSSGIFLTGLSD